METMVQLNSQTTGRDRLLRLGQFSCRLAWSILVKTGQDIDRIKRLQELESSIGAARQLLRLGRSTDVLYSALQSLHLPNPFYRLTITMSRISSSFYLLADHILWLGRTGFMDVNKSKWTDLYYRFWLYSTTLNLLRDAYEMILLVRHSSSSPLFARRVSTHELHGKSELELAFLRLAHWIQRHKSVSLDLVKNFCDFWIPYAALGRVSLSPGVVGLLGVISSVAAILQVADHRYKLSPS